MTAQNIFSEIDAIFASRQQASSSTRKPQKKESTTTSKVKRQPNEPTESTKPSKSILTQKAKSKRKSATEDDNTNNSQVVIDPSVEILRKTNPINLNSRVAPLTDDDIAFQDSRGKRARTDDGLPIYSVEELKIGLGGDTPECPFDCQCCF